MSAPGAPGAIRLFTERFLPPCLGRERDGERRSLRPGGRATERERLREREPGTRRDWEREKLGRGGETEAEIRAMHRESDEAKAAWVSLLPSAEGRGDPKTSKALFTLPRCCCRNPRPLALREAALPAEALGDRSGAQRVMIGLGSIFCRGSCPGRKLGSRMQHCCLV